MKSEPNSPAECDHERGASADHEQKADHADIGYGVASELELGIGVPAGFAVGPLLGVQGRGTAPSAAPAARARGFALRHAEFPGAPLQIRDLVPAVFRQGHRLPTVDVTCTHQLRPPWSTWWIVDILMPPYLGKLRARPDSGHFPWKIKDLDISYRSRDRSIEPSAQHPNCTPCAWGVGWKPAASPEEARGLLYRGERAGRSRHPETMPESRILTEAEAIDRRIPVEPGGILYIDLDRGSVVVTSHDEDEVAIQARARGWASRLVCFTLSRQGQRVQLEGDVDGWFPGLLGFARIEVRARIPRRCSVEIRTVGGRIKASEIGGELGAQTSGGRIDVHRVDGRALLRTSGGRISAEEVNGDVRARTSGGGIQLNYINGDVEARTSGGSIEVHGVRSEIDARTSGGRVSASFVGEPAGRIETSGGSIHVVFPAELGTTLDARTSGGQVRVDHEITSEAHNQPRRVTADLNGGGLPLTLRTSGGSIRVEAG